MFILFLMIKSLINKGFSFQLQMLCNLFISSSFSFQILVLCSSRNAPFNYTNNVMYFISSLFGFLWVKSLINKSLEFGLLILSNQLFFHLYLVYYGSQGRTFQLLMLCNVFTFFHLVPNG